MHAVIRNYFGGSAYVPGVTDQPGVPNTFKLPNLLGNVAVGAQSLENYNLGDTGGSDSYLLDITNLPKHRHTYTKVDGVTTTLALDTSNAQPRVDINNPDRRMTASSSLDTSTGYVSSDIKAVQGTQTINQVSFPIMQPYIALNYIIKT